MTSYDAGSRQEEEFEWDPFGRAPQGVKVVYFCSTSLCKHEIQNPIGSVLTSTERRLYLDLDIPWVSTPGGAPQVGEPPDLRIQLNSRSSTPKENSKCNPDHH